MEGQVRQALRANPSQPDGQGHCEAAEGARENRRVVAVGSQEKLMLWHTEPTSFDGHTMYVSGDWRIRHTSKGFGISDCSLYRDGEFVAQVVNENALSRLQELAAGVEACEKDARDAVCLT
jgi:hypothetical protein